MKRVAALFVAISAFGLSMSSAQAQKQQPNAIELKPYPKSFHEVVIASFCKFGFQFLLSQSGSAGTPHIVQVMGADGKPLPCTEGK